MNGEEVERDENGAFFLRIDLEPGTNTFTFAHKEKTITYTITRQVQIIKEISPLGNVTINGGMDITISATAYEGASLTAKLGSTTVTLTESKEDDDDTDNESTYVQYTGTITVPASTASVQKLGNIVVNATWESSYSESATGAYVTVAAKAGDGDLVKVTASSAETFPTNTLNDLSDYDCYPLPKGALDYTDGDEIVYKEGDNTFTYYNLQSGQRVYSKDVTSAGSEDLGGNSINGVTVNANSRYTYVIFNMDQKVSYVAKYTSGAFTIDFQYTSEVPDNLSLTKNPLFSSANWSGTKVSLKFNTTNGFLGYYAYFDGDDLIFRFNNPTGESSVDGVTVVVDVGHSKLGVGALGFLSAYGEYEINLAVGGYLKKELKSRGATVYLMDNGEQRPSLADRVAYANPRGRSSLSASTAYSSTSSSGKGTECWYFNRFSASLASYFSDAVSDSLNTSNRAP
jgi:N-acetylmuramoyl-L-alanine amidase